LLSLGLPAAIQHALHLYNRNSDAFCELWQIGHHLVVDSFLGIIIYHSDK